MATITKKPNPFAKQDYLPTPEEIARQKAKLRKERERKRNAAERYKKLSPKKVTEVKLMLARGAGLNNISQMLRVSKHTVSAIARGDFWCGRRDVDNYAPTTKQWLTYCQRWERKPKLRKMTQDDICNVEFASVDDLMDVLKMVTVAGDNELDRLEENERWTIVD